VQDCSDYRRTVNTGWAPAEATPFSPQAEVSNSDQLLLGSWAIIVVETGISSLSFRSSELSQLI
jgi:hypothetical protein